MKKFSFNLEKVLDVKIMEEKLLQRDLILCEEELKAAELRQSELNTEMQSEFSKKSLLVQKNTNVPDIMLIHNYIQSLEKDSETNLENISLLERKHSKIREQLINKTKEKKSLEKLKEIKLEAYKKEVKKIEQDFMDEIAIQIKNSSGCQEVL